MDSTDPLAEPDLTDPLTQATTVTDPLDALRDIHVPADVGLWPPAPGWWILAIAALAAAAWFIWRELHRRHQQRRCRSALDALDQLLLALEARTDSNDMELRLRYANDVNAVLRRVALLHFDQKQVAGLSGTAWTDFLKSHDKRGALTPELATILAHGRFAARCDIEPRALQSMASDWIKDLYMAKINTDFSTTTSKAANQHA